MTKSKLLTLGLLAVTAMPAFADKVKWSCDGLDNLKCPKTVDKTDYCEATDGIDTFNVKSQRDDKEQPSENTCLVSRRVVTEICGSEIDPAPFELKCTDIEDKTDPGTTPPADPGTTPPPPTHGGHHGTLPGNHGGGGRPPHGGGNHGGGGDERFDAETHN